MEISMFFSLLSNNFRLRKSLPYMFVLVLLILCLPSCVRRPKIDGLSVTNNGRAFEIDINGKRRGGVMYLPFLYDGVRPYSLVFVLHGASGTGETIQKTGQFDKLAEDLDYIMVYPNGISRRWESPDDLAFFDLMITEFQKKYIIDPERIYITGHSAGAIAAYRLAATLPGRIAAIAPVAGCVFEDTSKENIQPVSVLHIHSRNDEDVPFEGLDEWNMLSARASVDFWKKVNKANAESQIFYDSHGIEGTLWKGESCDTASLFYPAAGHSWPQLATDMIADFFYNHPARTNRIRIVRDNLPVTIGAESTLTLRCEVENPAELEKIVFLSNGSEIGTSLKKPWAVEWKVTLRGIQRLSAKAYMKDASVVSATLNPFLLVTAPAPEGSTAGGGSTTIPVVTASSTKVEERQYEAKYAVDGDFFTRWGSDWTDNESITLDLGAAHTVSGVTLMWEMAFGKQYVIELSQDGETWTQAVEKKDGQGGIEYMDFAPASARYVRMRGIVRATEWGYSLWEFFVHGE